MIYFVSYVLGLAKRGRENSENAISDDLEFALNANHGCASCKLCKRSAFISAQLPFMTEKFPAQK
jgi:hypothetical protein